METVNTVEEADTVVSKLGGRFYVATGRVTLGGRGGTKSKGGLHRRGGIKNVVQSSIGSMVVGGNTSWERMSGSVMKAAMRAGFYIWRRESVIRILNILTPRRYYYSILASLILRKDSFTGIKAPGSWQTVTRGPEEGLP